MPLAATASRVTRDALESLLRARRLDRTLTTSLPAMAIERASSGLMPLDARLGGGFPRGHVSELVGRRSSGRTSLLVQLVAAATTRGELVALVDTLDMFDVESAAAAGVDLDRLLWIRGFVGCGGGACPPGAERALEQALRAVSLVLQAGNFGVGAVAGARAQTAAVHDVAAAAAHGRRQPDRVPPRRIRARCEKRRRAHASSRESGVGRRESFRRPGARRTRHRCRNPPIANPESRLPNPAFRIAASDRCSRVSTDRLRLTEAPAKNAEPAEKQMALRVLRVRWIASRATTRRATSVTAPTSSSST